VDTIPGLTESNARKRALVIESELNRQVLRVELGRIRLQTERIKHGYGWAHGGWKWAVPIVGFLLAKKFKQAPGLFAKSSLVMSALGGLWKVWQIARAKKPSPAPPR
jgi:hypothetical protein